MPQSLVRGDDIVLFASKLTPTATARRVGVSCRLEGQGWPSGVRRVYEAGKSTGNGPWASRSDHIKYVRPLTVKGYVGCYIGVGGIKILVMPDYDFIYQRQRQRPLPGPMPAIDQDRYTLWYTNSPVRVFMSNGEWIRQSEPIKPIIVYPRFLMWRITQRVS